MMIAGASCRSSPFLITLVALAAALPAAETILPGTRPLKLSRPMSAAMVDGIHKFCMRELAASRAHRQRRWQRDFSSVGAYLKGVAAKRTLLRSRIGAVDARTTLAGSREFQRITTLTRRSLVARSQRIDVHAVRWPTLPGIAAEGLLLIPRANANAIRARVVVLPDADWTPEEFCGLKNPGKVDAQAQLARRLAAAGCLVAVPTLINRDDSFSGHPKVRYTNQPHREFIYRQAFELGRHPIGYEVQKIQAAIDLFEQLDKTDGKLPTGVVGIGEGALLALYASATDTRIDVTWVAGYFQPREAVWSEPIYRNVWGLLRDFGDADIASLIAPRNLTIEACQSPTVAGPPVATGGRSGAAPGKIVHCKLADVRREFGRLAPIYRKLKRDSSLVLAISQQGQGQAGCQSAMAAFAEKLKLQPVAPTAWHITRNGPRYEPQKRQKRQFDQLQQHVQNLLRLCGNKRRQRWQLAKSTLQSWQERRKKLRDHVYRELIGKLPHKRLPPSPRTRRLLETPQYVGYEIVLDVFPDIFAGGILLIPRGIKQGEQRPVVVCQHGLEGKPIDTISRAPAGYRFYRSFSAELCKRGYVVYAPQNPYIGLDRFRSIQRKSNPLQRTLFSYIIPQHQQTVDWLGSLPFVDRSRIAFYGLSYGGKTAMRVPPFVDGYCLSICSGDFTRWVKSIATNEERYGYIFTSEYEIPEWNMGHVAGYAELAKLMAPRPFMVEQGYRDGGAPPRWVAGEYEPVRRHYVALGIPERTAIEFFNGGHRINGKGTFAFLRRHLKYPDR